MHEPDQAARIHDGKVGKSPTAQLLRTSKIIALQIANHAGTSRTVGTLHIPLQSIASKTPAMLATHTPGTCRYRKRGFRLQLRRLAALIRRRPPTVRAFICFGSPGCTSLSTTGLTASVFHVDRRLLADELPLLNLVGDFLKRTL